MNWESLSASDRVMSSGSVMVIFRFFLIGKSRWINLLAVLLSSGGVSISEKSLFLDFAPVSCIFTVGYHVSFVFLGVALSLMTSPQPYSPSFSKT